jgi:hypothetical protein
MGRDFVEYQFDDNYRDDLIIFYQTIVKSNAICDKNKSMIYSELIRLGKINYIYEILKLKTDNESKLQALARGFDGLHDYQNKTQYMSVGCSDGTLTKSFNSYFDQNHTPDFATDGNIHTSWKINNIYDKDESTLIIYLKANYKKNNKVKILFGNFKEENSYFKYYRPRIVQFSLYSVIKNNKVYTKQIILNDDQDYHYIYLSLNLFQKISSYFIDETYYKLVFSIKSYYHGKIPNCYISEFDVIPLD